MTYNEIPELFLTIDEHGFIFNDDIKVSNPEMGFSILENLFLLENNSIGSKWDENNYIIEAFESPLIAQSVSKTIDGDLHLQFHYDYSLILPLKNFPLFLDEWDRIHGENKNKVPFTLSRQAQEEFFDLLDGFSDDNFEWNGEKYDFHQYWEEHEFLNGAEWWNQVYQTEENPRWNLASPSETLKDMLPRLKLPKSNILVLGCGDGHDAALFAQNGHLVTAIDISPHAIERAKKLHSEYKQITWLQADLFHLPQELRGKFDFIYEYTCFCAIAPKRRNELVQIWSQYLHEQGQLMGTFFCMPKRFGPPFGATEWELRKRLEKKFQFLFWGRWRKSLPRRQGRELFVLAKLK